MQAELEESIRARMADTRAKLLEYFDEWLWRLTAHELGEWADFAAANDFRFTVSQGHRFDGVNASV